MILSKFHLPHIFINCFLKTHLSVISNQLHHLYNTKYTVVVCMTLKYNSVISTNLPNSEATVKV